MRVFVTNVVFFALANVCTWANRSLSATSKELGKIVSSLYLTPRLRKVSVPVKTDWWFAEAEPHDSFEGVPPPSPPLDQEHKAGLKVPHKVVCSCVYRLGQFIISLSINGKWRLASQSWHFNECSVKGERVLHDGLCTTETKTGKYTSNLCQHAQLEKSCYSWPHWQMLRNEPSEAAGKT